jgi:hypothetical protein
MIRALRCVRAKRAERLGGPGSCGAGEWLRCAGGLLLSR